MRIESAVARSRETRKPCRRCASLDSDGTSSPAHDGSINGAFTAVGGDGGDDIPPPDEGKAGSNVGDDGRGGKGGAVILESDGAIAITTISAIGRSVGPMSATGGKGGDQITGNGKGGDGGTINSAVGRLDRL